MELVLEPRGFPPSEDYQKAMYAAGIPAIALISSDIHQDVQQLRAKGVVVRGEPTHMGPIIAVIFEDSCGNLVNLVQVTG